MARRKLQESRSVYVLRPHAAQFLLICTVPKILYALVKESSNVAGRKRIYTADY